MVKVRTCRECFCVFDPKLNQCPHCGMVARAARKPRPRKYLKGDTITTIGDLTATLNWERYVFLWDKPKHPGWILSMQYRNILYLLGRSAFRFAIKNPDYREPQRRR